MSLEEMPPGLPIQNIDTIDALEANIANIVNIDEYNIGKINSKINTTNRLIKVYYNDCKNKLILGFSIVLIFIGVTLAIILYKLVEF
jgi:hypothetical protein